MRRPHAFLLLSTAAGCARAADAPSRGVGPDFLSFYKPSSGTFQCISNPSVKLAYSQVNDDFCDCPDGSDEPGTSACAHLSSLSPQDPSAKFTANHALPGFFCQNKGHQPSYIPFTNVNDGICDYDGCCDGSDEYKNVGGVKCKDKCDEIGKEWRKNDEARRKSYEAAVVKRKQLTEAAAKKREEVVNEIATLKIQISNAESNVQKLTKEFEEVEKTESSRLAKSGGQSGKLGILVGLARPKMEELQNALNTMRDMRNQYWDRVSELEKILADLHTSYNPNFNDEGVKRVVRSYEEYKAKELGELDQSTDQELDWQHLAHGLDDLNWEEYEGDDAHEDSDVEALYSLQAYLPLSLRTWLSEKMADFRTMLIANGILAAPSTAELSESKLMREATERLSAARKTHDEYTKKKSNLEEDLTKDYGPDDVFRTLKGTCTSLDSGEYTYEMCWLDNVSQKSKKGGMGSQNMGTFSGYDTTEVDEDLPADGKGLGRGKRMVLKYEDGSHCWNGPSRSTTVVLACADTEEVWKVTEEEKCVYRMIVGTPAVCDVPGKEEGSSVKIGSGKAPVHVDHDEL